MDMSEPFAISVRAHLTDPEGKIVFDRYHLMGCLANDIVRKQENRAFVAAKAVIEACRWAWISG